MSSRPLSDRQHQPPEPDNQYEVRVAETEAAEPAAWRTIACTAEYQDADRVAAAVVSAPDGVAYSEVWGPSQNDPTGHRVVLARFPTPTREERNQMWIDAANQHYAQSYADLNH